jgi:hypothetical protein
VSSPRRWAISTRNVDRITFFLGSGLAGIGGVAIALISGTNPTLGTTYIIPAFLVVVAGGVGQLKGTVIAAWAVGVATAFLTDWTSGSMAQVITFASWCSSSRSAPRVCSPYERGHWHDDHCDRDGAGPTRPSRARPADPGRARPGSPRPTCSAPTGP